MFMGGLKPEVADGIRMFKPQSVKEAISLAKMRDDQLARQRRFTQPSALQASVPVSNLNPPKGSTQVAIKRLSWDEMQKRRAQGLCFNCNERFTPGHKCQAPQLMLLEGCIQEDETPEEMGGVNTTREISEIEEDGNGKEPEITLHALTRWIVPRTMRIKAIIGAHEVVALIDSGSTHNFISDRVAETLCLPVKPTTPFTVRVANGERLSCKGKYEKLTVNLQGNEFHLDFFFCALKWFGYGARHSVLEGQQNNEELSSDMQALLEEYSDVFAASTSLPPVREIDHKIPLKDGTEAINVRPYRYAYFQKTEIENQDRFPIPTVDDMLDELHGAAFFTKLDLKAGYHQIQVSTPDIPKTAFRTHNGHYEYLVMPFGLCNAPSTFQAIMNSIFRPYLRKFILTSLNRYAFFSCCNAHFIILVMLSNAHNSKARDMKEATLGDFWNNGTYIALKCFTGLDFSQVFGALAKRKSFIYKHPKNSLEPSKYARVIRVMIIAMTFEHHLKKVDLKKKGDHEKKANH
ncbi:Retrovirus-related Pol polyprotein from transposon 297 [Vitis vinifera]|uniref:Retrovirus-related Pol polyprotein from transposon 297 n=1 Tax=Vitis vinifera TaxID=29760 RepID=A0A438FYG6_VITVI|nr:Retrovirus-related Pol polyprotein from transposon 297 [Vitis vinifera]